jgi:hypothetical protein
MSVSVSGFVVTFVYTHLCVTAMFICACFVSYVFSISGKCFLKLRICFLKVGVVMHMACPEHTF